MDRNTLTHDALRELVSANQIRLFKPADSGRDAASDSERAAARPMPAAAGADLSNTAPANRQAGEVDAEGGGLDYLTCSVYGERAACWRAWIERMAEAKEVAREGNVACIELHELGEYAEVHQYSSGKGLGYCRYVLTYRGIRIEVSDHAEDPVGDTRRALARVTIPGRAFLTHDLLPAIELAEFALWCLGIVSNPAKWEPSRVDVCSDMAGETIEDFARAYGIYGEGCVTRARHTTIHAKDRRPETLMAGGPGSPIQLRVYDKLAEVGEDQERLHLMINNRWGGKMPSSAVRVEYQIRREPLRDMGIQTVDDLLDKLPELVAYLSEKWCRITGENVDRRNSQRFDGNALWRRVIASFKRWAGKGRALKRQTVTKLCLKRATAQWVGWTKSLAAACGTNDLTATRKLVDNLFAMMDPKEYRNEVDDKIRRLISMGRDPQPIPGIS